MPFNHQLALIGERPIQMMEKQALCVSMILNICLGSFKPELNMAQPIMTNSKVPRSKLTLFNTLVCDIGGVDEGKDSMC